MGQTNEAATAATCPKFNHPPVVETVLGIQFEQLPKFQTNHFGLFLNTIQDRFEPFGDQPRLLPIVENFPKAPPFPMLQFFGNLVMPQRVWYRNKNDNSILLQVQPDRFMFNWQRPLNNPVYPTYAAYEPQCLAEYGRFEEFCNKHELGEIKPNLCEVTYVNRIVPDRSKGESDVGLFAEVFYGSAWRNFDEWLPSVPEIASLSRVYVIPQERGRLYAEASISPDSIVIFKLTARIKCNGTPSVKEALRLAHDWVVNGFVSLTNPVIRKERWEQTQ